ncbi:FAD-binding oxidoreductase [Deinococcus yavapaiensis]|uniref:D-lactate dehydrogenase (cytochrome) n=1 Tax=Deinococcus yavapaiensis KR-236 TaxID=694435 RepID=A0A318SJF6_9DEIO|nr:FAD-linked oxidase C-terminal domain-containing protein [Deinococcus yavapaiensis]PYE54416.1 D-lactate dehydrogenase (cytochrome) [Deinococcus yavapaiensis KR-236]
MTTTILDDLRAALGAKVATSAADLAAHGHDEGYPGTYAPDAVVYAESEADVLAVLAFARTHGVSVTPFAAGSSLEGSAICVRGGVSLDVTRMNRVLSIEPDDFLAVVEPGVTHRELSRLARRHGLFFSVDPGADASLGGMAATGASGTTSVRYGTMKHNVLEARVALLDGRMLDLGTRARKSSAGYDLLPLFVGSEGTLGVFTRLTVRLHPLPPSAASVRVIFPDVRRAVDATTALLGAGVAPQRLELVDAETVKAVNAYQGRDDPEVPTLWIEVVGRDDADVKASLDVVEDVCAESGGNVVGRALKESERAALWTVRHHAYYALRAAAPGHDVRIGDVCVPISALPNLVDEARRLLDEHALHAPMLGHVGDGNLHLLFHAAPSDDDAWARIDAVSDALARHAIASGGTCTGEHGVGIRKRKYLRAEHGDALDVMRDLKRLFDPHELLNPGKIFE